MDTLKTLIAGKRYIFYEEKTDSNNVIELLNEILTFSDIVELERGELI